MKLLLAALLALTIASSPSDDSEAPCDTDCMRFCPPPADDPDCDGGPQLDEKEDH
jgi:hypothetical protein